MKNFLKFHLFPWILYLIGALIFTWPVALNLGQKVISTRSGDVWQHLWNQWWMPYSLLELHTHPFHTPLIFYPDGVNLYFHALHPLTGYLGMPLQGLFGLAASFVLVQFLQLTFAAYGCYLVARYLTGYYAPALVAGIIYAFCPLQAELLNLGQLELTSIEWLPFFVLFFLRTMREDKQLWLNRVLSALFLLALSFTTWYYTLYALIFSGLYLLWAAIGTWREWRKIWPNLLKRYAGFFLIWLLLAGPLLFLTIRDQARGGTQASQSLFTVIYNSADLSGFFRPGASAIWGIFGSQGSPEVRGQFLGFAVLILAGLGLVVCWKETRLWLYIGLIFFLLALGPVFHFTFDPDWSQANGKAEEGIPLLGQLLYAIPLGNIIRVPLRYTLVVMLALAVCSAYGIGWLSQRKWGKSNFRMQQAAPLQETEDIRRGSFRTAQFSLIVPLIAGLVVFLEFLPVPRTLADTTIPQFYYQIQDEGRLNDFALLELPDAASPKAMYYQTVHHHPINLGYISRKPASYLYLENIGVGRTLFNLQELPRRDIVDWPNMPNVPVALAAAGFRYLVIHPRYYSPPDWKFMSDRLLEIFGKTAPYYQDSELVVYRIPSLTNATPDAAKIIPILGDGWSGRIINDGNVTRSIAKDALLALTNPYNQNLATSLTVRVQSIQQPRNLRVMLGNRELLSQKILPDQSEINLKLDLPPGQTRLNFVAEGADGKNPSLVFGVFTINGQ